MKKWKTLLFGKKNKKRERIENVVCINLLPHAVVAPEIFSRVVIKKLQL